MQSKSTWDKKLGVARLRSLGSEPPPSAPHGPYLAAGANMEYWLHDLRGHATDKMEPELLDPRWAIWRQVPEYVHDAPAWMTLAADPDLRNYENLMLEDLELDKRSLDPFVTLVRRSGLGYSEACRVLYHGLKDKKNSGDPRYDDNGPDGKGRDPQAHSKWFKKAAEDAMMALDNPEHWRDLAPQRNKGGGKGKGKAPQGPHGTSANAWTSYSGGLVTPTNDQHGGSSRSSGHKTGWRPRP